MRTKKSKTRYSNPAADGRDPHAVPSSPRDRATGCMTFLRPKLQYTGDQISGVALLHKQSYQPVRRDNPDDACQINKMRRS